MEKIVNCLKIDISDAFSHLMKLEFVTEFDIWVPYSLTEEKLDRVSAAMSLLLPREKELFLDIIAAKNRL